MVVISKHLFDEKFKSLKCSELIHVWHPDCFEAGKMFTRELSKGLIIFFGVMYGAQYLLQMKIMTRNEIKNIIRDYIGSICFAHVFILSGYIFLCSQRKLLGSFNYYLTTIGLGILVGSTGFMSPKSRFTIESTSFSVAALECIIKYLVSLELLPKNKYAATPLFMVCNAIMMNLLWKKQNTDNSLSVTWIFKPFSRKELSDNKLCSHKGSCKEDFFKVTSKYTLIGGGISLIKLLLTCYKKKDVNILKLLNKSHLKYPLFFGGYVGICKGVYCILTQGRGKDNEEHALIAGFLSGIVYLLNPNLSLVTSLTVLIAKAIFKDMKNAYLIQKLPYEYLTFILSTAVFVYFTIINPKILPASIINMLKIVTKGRSTIFLDIIHNIATAETIK